MPKVAEPFVESTTAARRRLWAPQDLPEEDDDTCDWCLDDTMDPGTHSVHVPPRPRPPRRGLWLVVGVGAATMFTGIVLVILAVGASVAVGVDALGTSKPAITGLP